MPQPEQSFVTLRDELRESISAVDHALKEPSSQRDKVGDRCQDALKALDRLTSRSGPDGEILREIRKTVMRLRAVFNQGMDGRALDEIETITSLERQLSPVAMAEKKPVIKE